MKDELIDYCLRLGDSSLILSHRIAEYCSKAPILEEDLAITNVGLDLLGQEELMAYLKTKNITNPSIEIHENNVKSTAQDTRKMDHKCNT